MKRHKMKKLIKILLVSLIMIVAIFLVGAWSMFGTKIIAANTITKLDTGLYSLEYKGDYGFDDFLAQGGASSDAAVADYLTSFLSHGFYKPDNSIEAGDFGCSTLTVKTTEGDVLFGRNYDWADCSAMIVRTRPNDGYESISTCCLDFLGFDKDWQADGSMMDRMMALAAVYVPLDGMNEKGLMIADLMAGDKAETHQDTAKPDLTTTTAIRLLLDKAATVDEAILLLKQYDMNSSIGSAHHYSICDAGGESVVVEYIDNEIFVTKTNVVTNHYLTDSNKYGIGSEQSHVRFGILTETLNKSGSVMNEIDVRDALKSVAQFNFREIGKNEYEKTMWSIVYHPAALTVNFYRNEDYEHAWSLKLLEGDNWVN
jgi:predicted choloylglycine hydrolase